MKTVPVNTAHTLPLILSPECYRFGNVFTMRCTIVQSAVLPCHPPVCLCVKLVDCDCTGWKTWILIAWTISPTPLLFVAQRPSTCSQGNMGKFETRGGVGKVECWSTKAAISLKCIKIVEKLLWKHIGTHQRFFGRYHSRNSTAPLNLDWRFATPAQPKIAGKQVHIEE